MSAKDFFLTELPPLLAEWKEKLGARAPKVSFDVEFDVEGEGMFTVATKDGTASVRRGGAANPIVSMRFAKKTWDESLERIIRPRFKLLHETDAATLEAKGAAEMKKQLGGRTPVTPEQMLAAIKALPLRVTLDVQPANGQRFELATAGAEEDDPTVTVTAAEADIQAMFSGELPPPVAFQQGKVKMKGAVPTAMALISRLFV